MRDGVAPAVRNDCRDVNQVFAGIVFPQFYLIRRAGCPDRLRRPFLPILIGDDFHGAGLINDLVPAEPVVVRPFLFHSLGFPVDKELRAVAGGIDVDRRYLTFPTGPGPVREDVRHFDGRVPAGLVGIIPVLWEAGQVENAEIRTPGRGGDAAIRAELLFGPRPLGGIVEIGEFREVLVVGGRLAEIVVARLDEFAGHGRRGVFVAPFIFGKGRSLAEGRMQIRPSFLFGKTVHRIQIFIIFEVRALPVALTQNI